jgi:hypothetical protein
MLTMEKNIKVPLDDMKENIIKWLMVYINKKISNNNNLEISFDKESGIGMLFYLNKEYAIFNWDENEKRPYFIICFDSKDSYSLLYMQEFFIERKKEWKD